MQKAVPQLYKIWKESLSHLPIQRVAPTFFHVTAAGLTLEHKDARHEPTYFHAFLLTASPRTPEKEPTSPMYSLRTAHVQTTYSTEEQSEYLDIDSDNNVTSVYQTHTFTIVSAPLFESLSHSSSSSRSVPAPDSDQPDPTRYASALIPLANRRLLSHRRNILASNLPVLHRETLQLSSLVGRFLLFPGT
jgi:hypothetical protein